MAEKRGQVTIFIIIAIIIVVAVVIYFLWIQPQYVEKKTERLTGFEGCVQDAIEGEISALGRSAGFIEPAFTYMYNGEDVAYLCYTNLYYQQCIVQQPFLKQQFEQNLKRVLVDKVNNCYEGSVSDLRNRGYDVAAGNVNFNVTLEPGQIVVNIKAPSSISSGSDSQRYTGFDAKIPNKLYEMVMIATSIVQSETKFGDADVTTIMIYYPQFIIDKIKRSDGTTIYIITDKDSEFKLQFASRSIAQPAGYGFNSGLIGEQ